MGISFLIVFILSGLEWLFSLYHLFSEHIQGILACVFGFKADTVFSFDVQIHLGLISDLYTIFPYSLEFCKNSFNHISSAPDFLFRSYLIYYVASLAFSMTNKLKKKKTDKALRPCLLPTYKHIF